MPISFLVLAFGALALSSQVILLRQLMVAFYGTEAIVALVFSGWLVGVFLGARIAGRFRLAGKNLRRSLMILPVIWALVLASLLGLSYFISPLTGLSPGEVAPMDQVLFWVVILTMPASMFVGGLFVLSGKYIHETQSEASTRVGGWVFWIESAGSCIGLLLHTFLLAVGVGPIQSLGTLIGFMWLALFLALPTGRGVRGIGAGLVILVFFVVLPLGLGPWLDHEANRIRFHYTHPTYQMLVAKDTPYQHLTLAERGGEYALFGNHIFMNSWPDPYQYQVQALFYLTEAAKPERILLAGGGLGGLPREFLSRPVKKVTYVALDPAETELTAGRLTPEEAKELKDPRFVIVHDDLRHFLRNTPEQFDLAVIEAPDPDNAMINRLYTVEFFREAGTVLSPEGVLVTSIGGAENFWSPELISYGVSLYRTMREVFPEVLVTPGDRHYFLAGVKPGLVSSDADFLKKRYLDRGYQSEYFTPNSFPLFFPPTGTDYIRDKLAEFEGRSVRLNTDTAPLSYILRLLWWEKMTGKRWTQGLLGWALDIESWGPWAALVLFVPFLILIGRPEPAPSAWWTLGLTGGMTMALQIILIFLFQNHFGVVYQWIGALTAMYMAGLALGGRVGTLYLERGGLPWKMLAGLELGLALCGLTTALAAREALSALILPLVGLTGLISGMEFSLTFALLLEDRRYSVDRALSVLEASDHAGGFIGALLTGLVLAPVLGLVSSALILAAYKLAGSALFIRLGQKAPYH